MSRSLAKGPYIAYHLWNKIKTLNAANQKKSIKTWSRSSVIHPKMIGYTISVYNGKKHIPIFIFDSMVGHKLGEFSHTRTFKKHTEVQHPAKKNIKDYKAKKTFKK